jgi:hypothetical protein
MGERERRKTLAALLSDLLPSEKEEKIYEVLCLISIRDLLALRNTAARAQLPFTGESNRQVSLCFRQLQLSKNGEQVFFTRTNKKIRQRHVSFFYSSNIGERNKEALHIFIRF